MAKEKASHKETSRLLELARTELDSSENNRRLLSGEVAALSEELAKEQKYFDSSSLKVQDSLDAIQKELAEVKESTEIF